MGWEGQAWQHGLARGSLQCTWTPLEHTAPPPLIHSPTTHSPLCSPLTTHTIDTNHAPTGIPQQQQQLRVSLRSVLYFFLLFLRLFLVSLSFLLFCAFLFLCPSKTVSRFVPIICMIAPRVLGRCMARCGWSTNYHSALPYRAFFISFFPYFPSTNACTTGGDYRMPLPSLAPFLPGNSL